MKSIKYDEINYWSEVKLDIVKKYASAYSKIIANQPVIKKHIYIDGFAGHGVNISKRTGEFIPGSPLNAMNIHPPFSEIHLIDLDSNKADSLRKLVSEQSNVFIYKEDSNEVLLKKVFPRCLYEDYHRALCLLDPYSLNVNWSVLETAGKMKSIEIFYNFMIMDANMNVLWNNPDKVDEKQAQRMDAVWGDRSWRNAAYITQRGLFEDFEEKAGNRAVAEAFRDRLLKVAGFKYVPEPIPMRNQNKAIIYYLFFASPNETGAHIVKDIFDKYRSRGVR